MTDTRSHPQSPATAWNTTSGNAWVEMQPVLDGLFKPLEDLLIAGLPCGQKHRLLDVGCGAGATTLAAARKLGTGAQCVGLDVSEPMIAAARARAEREAAPVRFVLADAQTYPFTPGGFDIIVSRFGVMFFEDFVTAFSNLRRATAGRGRLRLLAWRSPEENPFMTVAARAASPLLPNLAPRDPDAPGQFAFGRRDRVKDILDRSGWADIAITPVDVVCAMPESELVRYITRLGPIAVPLMQADEDTRARVIHTVRPAFDPYVEGDAVRFTAACWLIEASTLAA